MSKKGKRIAHVFGGIAISSLLLLCSFDLYNLYSTALYPDDFHYWASGAFWAGYDWSGMLWHHMYYSYGFGLLLAPFFAFTNNGIVLFRMGIILNYLLRIAGYWMLVRIGTIVFKEASKVKIYVVCFLACMYPAWLLQVNSGLSEGVLYFLFILIALVLVELEKSYSLKKAVLLGFLTVYIYMIHQRMLAVTIAVIVTVTVMYFIKKINKYCLIDYLLTVAFSFGTHFVIKPAYQDYLYINHTALGCDRSADLRGVIGGIWLKVILIYVLLGILLYLIHRKNLLFWIRKNLLLVISDGILIAIIAMLGIEMKQNETLLNNDFGVMLKQVNGVFTETPLVVYVRAVLGHFFYVFVASGGMAVYIVLCSLADALRIFRKKEWQECEPLGMFVGISAFLILGVSALFMSSSVNSRIDVHIYGRYCECLIPILLVIGILKIGKEGIRWKELLSSILLFGVSAYSVYGYYKQGEIFGFFTDTRFLSTSSPALYWEFSKNVNGTIEAVGVGLLLLLVLMLASRLKIKVVPYILIALVGVMFLMQGKDALYAYIIPIQELQDQGNEIAEVIETKYDEYDLYFIRNEDSSFESIRCSGYFQLRLPKKHMIIVNRDEAAGLANGSIVICYRDDEASMMALEKSGFEVLKRCSTAVSYIKGTKTALAGDGTKDSPYLIQDASDLGWFRDAVNSGEHFEGKYFRQIKDIDLENMEWDPIGVFGTDYYFSGYYNGDGHVIKNLFILSDDNCAFFSVLAGTVTNLGIESGSIEGICAAGIAGHSYGAKAQVINCYNKATVKGSYRAGGIVDNFGGYVCNCINMGELKAPIIGEIAAHNAEKAVYCYGITDKLFPEDTFLGWEYECRPIIVGISELAVKQINRNAYWLKQDISVSLGELCYWRYDDKGILFAEDSPYSDWKYVWSLYAAKMASYLCMAGAIAVLGGILVIKTGCSGTIRKGVLFLRQKAGLRGSKIRNGKKHGNERE